MNFSQIILDNHSRLESKIALKYKENNEWKGYPWLEFHNLVKQTANALKKIGVKPNDNIAIYADNMPQWIIMDLAILTLGAVTVPIFATLTVSQAQYIIDEAEIEVILTGGQKQYDNSLEIIANNGNLKHIIAAKKSIELKGEESYYFHDFIKGESFECGTVSKNEDETASIIYTSGTTGEPKGVMLTHGNYAKVFEAHVVFFNLNPENENSLVFLPLSHVFEKCWSCFVLAYGGQLSFCENPREVAQYLVEAQPTTMCSVPRFFQKIYNSINEKIENSSKSAQNLFKWAISIGGQVAKLKRTGNKVPFFLGLKYKLADKLVFNKVKKQLGGKLWFIPVGGAAITADITEFLDAIGIHITVGYGLTETTATVSAFPFVNYKYGTAGKPMTGVQVTIGENDEILIKGNGIFKGYYKKPEETKKVFTEDGWFKSGDAGEIDKDGDIIITDRIKDLMKTSNGKYVSPQLVENLLTNDNYIQEAVLIGDNRPYVTALIVPDFDSLKRKAEKLGVSFNTLEELSNNQKIIDFYTGRVSEIQKDLAGHEKVKKFKLLSADFDIESGEITPTLKVKRRIVLDKFKDLITNMYN